MDNIFFTAEEAVAAIKRGEMIIVVDNEKRENEGDFIIAAQFATPEMINLMASQGKGLICQPITLKRAEELQLPPMESNSSDPLYTAFTVSVDARDKTTTGISAFERSHTIETVIAADTKPEDLCRPGHMFPLVAQQGGVLKREGHTEASIDLCRLAGLYPSGVICEIMDDNGEMARLPRLKEIARKLNMKILKICDLVTYIKEQPNSLSQTSEEPLTVNREESPFKVEAETALPTAFGLFKVYAFSNQENRDMPHLALVKGEVSSDTPVVVRIHSECLTGEVLMSLKCDCRSQLHQAMELIEEEGGVLLYLRQEGRGIGLVNKIKAYELQKRGADTVEANLALNLPVDKRDYQVAAKMLKAIGVQTVKLITNNPDKIDSLKREGIDIRERIESKGVVTEENRDYLKTKIEQCNHLLNLIGEQNERN